MSEPTPLEEWLVGRAPVIAHMARALPPGTELVLPDGKRRFVVSYTEDETLGVSAVDPFVDYDRAHTEKEFLCASHVPGYLPFDPLGEMPTAEAFLNYLRHGTPKKEPE
jgi:hypothetical protein